MQHWILRCKHCQKEYTYCTYGNGPEYGTEAGCSQEYCAECQQAIDKALSTIPIKFKPQLVEIVDTELLQVLEKIREEDAQKDYIKMTSILGDEDYDIGDRYTHKGKVYYIKYDRDTPDEKHLFVAMQYDLLKKELTKNYWRADDMADSYMHGEKSYKALYVASPMQIPPPIGELAHLDFGNYFTWGIVTKKEEDDN